MVQIQKFKRAEASPAGQAQAQFPKKQKPKQKSKARSSKTQASQRSQFMLAAIQLNHTTSI